MFCEKWFWEQLFCFGGGYEGFDICFVSCEKDKYWVVVVEDVCVIDVWWYWVMLQMVDGMLYNYFYLNMVKF